MVQYFPVITGSLTVNGNLSVTGTTTVSASNSVSSSYAYTASSAVSSSYAYTASSAVNSFSASKAVSSSYADTASFANNFTVLGNLTVFGTQSVQYITSSQLNVSDNVITVNVASPGVRFGGLSVFDSGSLSSEATASLFWDSQNNHWIYQRESGSTYTGGMLISGPRNAAGLGNEQGTTSCMLLVGQGGDHLTSSLVYHDTNCTNFYSNALYISSSGNVGIGTNAPSSSLEVKQSSNNRLLIDCVNVSNEPRISSLDASNNPQYLTINSYDLKINTNGNRRLFIDNTGVACFSCQTCAPQFITSQGSSVSYASGTNYTIWNSEVESCIQDSNNPAAYTRIKTWIADRSGCATIRYTGYIQSGPTYWGYRVTRNGTSSYMCVAYSACVQPGCAEANVHAYSSYQFNVGPFLPGDCIGLDVVSTGGGATPTPGQGQWIFAKEFRVFSTTPNLSAGTSGNVFGEWVGIGTCTPFSNLYINGNNPAIYDASVDNGQDGCGVTLTVRNNSTVNNSFAQLNMQVSGDSGRAIGRIALIRKDSASSHMAFAIETANTKTEIMRMGCFGASSHNFLMVGRTNAGISAGTGITLNATTGQIESSVTGDDILNLNRNVSDGKIIRLFKNCLEVGSISTNANSLPSDANFKRNIDSLDLGLNLITKLRPVSYNYKVDDCGSPLSTGFIAQEMECSLNELGVEKNKYHILQHAPVEDPKESQYSLDYTKMIPILTKAIQEQQCTICSQASMINTLKTCIGIA